MTCRPGQILAVAFSNFLIYLTNAHTGKMIQQIDYSVHSKKQINMLGWGVNFADVHAARKKAKKLQSEAPLVDVFSQEIHSNEPSSLPDLPRDLAFLDVEEVLPKLSSLSISSAEKEYVS